MKGTKPRTVNTLGMFDLFKGIGMAVVVLAHTAELYTIDLGSGLSVSSFILFIYREAMMSAFYIASGYGFRKRSIGKCFEQQLKGVLPYFLYTALATTGLHMVLHYSAFGYWPGTLAESERVLGGFLLGLPHTAVYSGLTFFSCGPMWYLLTMAVGWVLLDILVNALPERYLPFASAFVAALGWGICLVWELPWCLAQGMTVVPYLYLGHLAKKHHWFENPLPTKIRVLVAASALITAAGALLTGETDNMSMGHWNFGPVSILANGIVGLGIVSLFIHLGQRADGFLSRGFQAVGRRSLHIFCVHTIELIAVPWYLFAANFTDQPLVGLASQFLLRSALIAVVCLLLELRRYLPSRKRRARYISRHEARRSRSRKYKETVQSH